MQTSILFHGDKMLNNLFFQFHPVSLFLCVSPTFLLHGLWKRQTINYNYTSSTCFVYESWVNFSVRRSAILGEVLLSNSRQMPRYLQMGPSRFLPQVI